MRVVGLAGCLLAVASFAAAKGLAVDASLIRVEPPEWGGGPPPFIAHFEKDGMNLYYVAAEHGPRSATLKLIRRVLAEHPVRLVILEGFTYHEGFDPRSDAGWERLAGCDESYCREGPGGYASMLAAKKKIPLVGGEPPAGSALSALSARGYTPKDLMGYHFLRWLPQFAREGRLREENIPSLYASAGGDRDEIAEASGGPSLSYPDFEKWYERRNGKPFSLNGFERDEVSPKPNGRRFTQRMASAEGRLRDEFVLKLTARKLPSARSVLIVFGSGHFFLQREALEKMLGRPEIERLPSLTSP